MYFTVLQTDIDIREKKSGIIDFIASGIATVGIHYDGNSVIALS